MVRSDQQSNTMSGSPDIVDDKGVSSSKMTTYILLLTKVLTVVVKFDWESFGKNLNIVKYNHYT